MEKDGGIFSQYLVRFTQPVKYKQSHIFAVFVPVLTALCLLGLKVLERFCSFL